MHIHGCIFVSYVIHFSHHKANVNDIHVSGQPPELAPLAHELQKPFLY